VELAATAILLSSLRRFNLVECIPDHGCGRVSEYNVLVWDMISQKLGDDNTLRGSASTVYRSVSLLRLLFSFVLYTSLGTVLASSLM
jgi:hypothetical protein